MVVEPTQCDEVVGVGGSSVGPVDDVVGLESVARRAAVDAAAVVTSENGPTEPAGNLGGFVADVEGFAVCVEGDVIDGGAGAQ